MYALCVLSTLLCVVQAISLTGSRTLIIYDDRLTELDDYSHFFNTLKDHSFDLQFKDLADKETILELYDKEFKTFDNLIVFPIKGKHINRQLSVDLLLKFYQDGGNIITITSPNAVPDSIRVFLNQLGIYPSPKGQTLTDYFQDGSAIQISSDNLLNEHIHSEQDEVNYQFGEASVALLDNRDLIIPLLRSTRTSFDAGKLKEAWDTGSQGYLMASFQNLQNDRLTWVGSSDFFLNEHSQTNAKLIKSIIEWTFNEKAVLKAVNESHHSAQGISYDDVKYKVNDDIVYNIGISEWKIDQWVPFVANDVQFELRQVDPYYRLNLSLVEQDDENATVQMYTTGVFKLPTRHGVFTFLTDYKRSGLSFIKNSDVKSIRHLANDEYPRSWEITNAWVYMAAISMVILAWIIFVVAFLTSSPNKIVTPVVKESKESREPKKAKEAKVSKSEKK